MKAIVKYKDARTGKYRQKTINVKEDEPNHIVREFIKATEKPLTIYITTIKCGRREYQWFGMANGAYPGVF